MGKAQGPAKPGHRLGVEKIHGGIEVELVLWPQATGLMEQLDFRPQVANAVLLPQNLVERHRDS